MRKPQNLLTEGPNKNRGYIEPNIAVGQDEQMQMDNLGFEAD
jgi:hypothetical protein